MSLDHKIDDLGFLHLSTLQPYVFHMGNTLSERLLAAVEKVTGAGVSASPAIRKRAVKRGGRRQLVGRLAQHPRFNRWFLRLYNFLFQALFGEERDR
jgi:hypothetical protein